MHINSISDFRKAVRHPYAWPGGYPTYFICDDGSTLCHACARAERRQILGALVDSSTKDWRVIGLDINYEDDLVCDHCYQQIESAYGEKDHA
jgi:hypothetical protein